MATNNFGLGGIGDNVQFGKKGNRIKNDAGKLSARDVNDSTYVPISAADPVADNDLVTKSYLENTFGTASNRLEAPADGDITDNGAVTTWEVGNTTYSTAIDNLNEILGRLVPVQPPALSSFSLAPTGGNNELLASSASNNSGSTAPSAGSSVYTVFNSTFTSTQANGGSGATGGDVEGENGNLFQSGNSGTLSAFINGVQDGSITLTEASDTGTYSALQVLSDAAYPASTPGFYAALKARISKSAVPVGYNEAYLEHSETGSTNTVGWVYDDIASGPSISATSYQLDASNTGKFSSGIKHLTNGDTISVNGTFDNLVGQTYITGTVARYSTSPSVGTLAMNATELGTGLTFPLEANLPPQTLSGRVMSVDSTARFVSTSMYVSGYNSRGSDTNNPVSGDPILVYTTALEGSNKPHESMVNGSSADAYRYYLGSTFTGDVPSGTLDAPTVSNWNENQLLNAAGYEHEGVVVAGSIKNDQTNYTVNHIPVTAGADYSTKDSSQYVTYVFNQATLSSISLSITGNYSGLWVALPGVSDDAGISPNALGGNWWNAFALYNGSGVPGRNGDSNAGCAVGGVATGNSGTVNMTFGTQSSTNSTNNAVIVRIKLNAGESISAISIGNTP